ncbi:unnamed protein product [Symbiodinium sp. KB8]|nr:unnamed protein product [Symbiodinium sp. KB8]
MKMSGATASMGVRYTVVLDGSEDRQFGLDFELIDPLNCLIGGVNDAGQAALWNASVPYGQRIRRFDCLRRVNGKTAASKDLVEALVNCQGKVELDIERPTAIEVEVTRRGRKLGLMVAPSKLNLGLVVRGIEDSGAIATLGANPCRMGDTRSVCILAHGMLHLNVQAR